jgi:hypothetical protein
MKTQNKELLNNILNGTILYGYLEIFKWTLKILLKKDK